MQAEERVRGPAKAASAVLAAVAAAQFGLTGTHSVTFRFRGCREHARNTTALITHMSRIYISINLHMKITSPAGAALAVEPPVLQGKDTPQIFSPKDAQDQKEGRVSKQASGSKSAAAATATLDTVTSQRYRGAIIIRSLQGQKPSSKYVEQAKEFTSDTAAAKVADAPTINKKGGGVGRADFAPSQQPGVKAAGKADLAPKDIRGGTHIDIILHNHPRLSLLPSTLSGDISCCVYTLFMCLKGVFASVCRRQRPKC